MFKTLKMVCVTLLAISSWSACSTANAQGFNRIDRPFDRPTFSPYLNLFRGGGGPVLNYFGTVRPQQEFYAQDQQLERQLDGVQGRQNQQFNNSRQSSRIPGVYKMGVTGHTTGFMTIRAGGAGGQNSLGQQAGGGNMFRDDQFGGGPAGVGGQPGNSPGGGDQFSGGQFGGGGGGYGNPYGGYSGHSSGFGFGSGF